MDGCIILDQTFLDEELLKYTDKNYKIVFCTGQVLLDNKAGAKLAVRELLGNKVNKLFAATEK